jgi:adenylate cyclase
MAYDYSRFEKTVANDYDRRRGLMETAALSHGGIVAQTRALGHPHFESLRLGQKGSASIATVFLDLTNFTGRTFWDDPGQVADLADAILSGFIEVVSEFGGFPLGLRGDGLFAGFGPGTPSTDCALALAACAFSLEAVQTRINPMLQGRGIAPVQARAGVDYGEVTFIRTGSVESNDVNQIGFAANFAAKCEKKALSWQVVAGQGAARQLGSATAFVHHEDSPKRYMRDGQTREYRFYDYRWREVLPYLPSLLDELGGTPSTAIKIA